MKKHLLLVAGLIMVMVAVTEPALAQEKQPAPGSTVDGSKAAKGGKQQTKAKAKKKSAGKKVKIRPLKKMKEMVD